MGDKTFVVMCPSEECGGIVPIEAHGKSKDSTRYCLGWKGNEEDGHVGVCPECGSRVRTSLSTMSGNSFFLEAELLKPF
jgi:hypothetical protein